MQSYRSCELKFYIILLEEVIMPKDDTPRVFGDDSLKIEVKSHHFRFKGNHDQRLNEQIAQAINLMGAPEIMLRLIISLHLLT